MKIDLLFLRFVFLVIRLKMQKHISQIISSNARKVCKKFKTNVIVQIPSSMRRFCNGKDAIVVFDKDKDFLQ